ncbi:Formylglycine-generating enzyme, required for sulfatase activity, contains SUMF1/FGE domain [Solimonas aquatica]|uniref:Formylglycine-generating enzyme, required for sulfatase activity, contains SUMF1/FGE domain n=1 Tax=Solimonas aquatica TaxID=489703 RepID=A0A1H9GCS3_9GAMM|nr:formylglycine-generating enzyme family protein [Solimonas aquatica]SEQ47568.1 Formylglycine-generating enzyme, required for sulfatase activity, contains SUMF1/FGE domain [Solimonas aquatica]
MKKPSLLLLALCLCWLLPGAARAACSTQSLGETEAHLPIFRDCEQAPEMVLLPAGSFLMGNDSGAGNGYDLPLHEVRVNAFAIGRHEVTRGQWQACVRDKVCESLPDGAGDPRLPAAQLSWKQAQRYLQWLSVRSDHHYRLPSEAEWEYAARAGTQTQYSWGNLSRSACSYANSFDRSGRAAYPAWNWDIDCDDGYAQTAPVGSFAANAWGLYDMLGNVWEWVQDCWNPDYRGAPSDARAWLAGDCGKRVNRGGGWGNHPRSLKVFNRDADGVDSFSDGLGFRVARDVPAAK